MKLVRLLAVTLALSLVACKDMPWNKHKDKDNEGSTAKMQTKTAVARISAAGAAATQPAMGKTSGTLTFTQTANNVKIVGDLTGLPPGKHGIHIHEKGDLSAGDLMSAGGHYNPDKHPHGGPTTSPVHAGDLGNLEANSDGIAHFQLTVDDISIGGHNDILGKSVIIHAKPDDFSTQQPPGNAGARIAGGVIEKQ